MKKENIFILVLLLIFSNLTFISCGDSSDTDEGYNNADNNDNTMSVVGVWQCDVDSYGDRWDKPLYINFTSAMTAFIWFSDEPFSDRSQFEYILNSRTIKLISKDNEVTSVSYELSRDGKTLTIYGLDDNDMAVLSFKKVSSNVLPDGTNNPDGNDNDNENNADNFISTESKIMQEPTRATLFGFLRGVYQETEVGFLLSLSPEVKPSESRKFSLKSSGGRFDKTIDCILDQETYYYRAFAKVNGEYHYGEIRSFVTEPFTYTVNGKEFKVIKVEGGPYGTFSILQTEISAKDKVIFAGIDLDLIIDCDKIDGNVSLYEIKKYIGNLTKKTGFQWRYPTSSEWQFAAEGGINSKNFKFSGSNDIDQVAWYSGNCIGPRESGLKKANKLGINDMSGNFAEITNDKSLKYLETGNYADAQHSEYFDWNKSKAYGGGWYTNANSCATTSYMDTEFLEPNLVDGKKYAFRLIYSHNINANNDN